MEFPEFAAVPVDPSEARVYEHGWQSWSPASTYPVTTTSFRARTPVRQIMGYRPGRPAPAGGFQGEGLLVVEPGGGAPVTLYAAEDTLFAATDTPASGAGPVPDVPSIRAVPDGDTLRVSASGPIVAHTAPDLRTALARWADRVAAVAGVGGIRPAPTVWCSWYHYFAGVTEADIEENARAAGAADLRVDVVQIDDGWESEVGDWLTLSPRFTSLPALAGRVHDTGRRAGIWVAPFLAGAKSTLAREHPDWLLEDASAGHNWGQDLYALDTTHPGVRGYLRETFGMLRDAGYDYFKIDFLYAGALDAPRHSGADPLTAYRSGIRLIRETIGDDAYLVGCGAPILPSVGVGFDAMRVGPDTAPHYEPPNGDPSPPSQFGAALSTAGRAFQQGRFWVNDPDCLIVREGVERREDWARVVERYGGLRASSDRIASLDEWGLATTRRLLADVPPARPFPSW